MHSFPYKISKEPMLFHIPVPSKMESRSGISFSQSDSVLGWMLTLRI